MNDFVKRLLCGWSAGRYDLDKNGAFTQDIGNLYKRQNRKAVIECYVRLAAAVAIAVYGAIGIKYNTGWYVTWALFVAIVGVNGAIGVIMWYWQIHTKLSIQRYMKELQLQIAELADKKTQSEN
jgi:Flp pilus assembly protein TadB